jgi:MEDS: MEthanogen/methylotroph, DcmR Sensory domain
MTQGNNRIQHNHKNSNNNNDSKKMVIGSSEEIVDMMASKKDKEEKKLIEPGSHNLLIYNDLKAFREIYEKYVSSLLSQNEIILISTQYDTIEEVKNTLRLAGIDAESYLSQGTLFILDAQHGYQGVDIYGMWKLAMSLVSRAKKEGRSGVSWFGDLGSFFSFEKIEELMQYELRCPYKYEDEMIKTVCCYHLEDFGNLSETQQQTLFEHHFKSILVK